MRRCEATALDNINFHLVGTRYPSLHMRVDRHASICVYMRRAEREKVNKGEKRVAFTLSPPAMPTLVASLLSRSPSMDAVCIAIDVSRPLPIYLSICVCVGAS